MLAGKAVIRGGEETIRLGYGCERSSPKDLQFLKKLTPQHHLTNFEIQEYYQKEPRFNSVYSGDNLPHKTKDGAYVINLDEYSDIKTHWIAIYVNSKTITYFDSLGVKHIPKEIKKFIDNKNITTNIFRIQAYDSIMCTYFCVGFIDFMLKEDSLTDFTNLFPLDNFKKKKRMI